ncbi:MAG TPA: ArsA-related P-loop ATPase [Vicinamibacteria bacterium]|nr:ArsA-related P-loop ATPase [Vicinamibacteria bacterium]
MSQAPLQALSHALDERRVLVVCGAGGVGKTTIAAALGVQAAIRGRRVLVCTIDPSRRLATSLGLDRLPDHPRELELARVSPDRDRRGALWAMTLDTKRTFDAIVEKHAATEAARRRILENRFYQQVSAALAGSHEYMAMEKLLELSADERFDLVILDTPPTRHALDFLEAPDRLMGFLDTSILRWFLKPYFAAGRLTLRVATRTGAMALKLADRVLGLQFLQDLSEFFLAFEGMYAGFKVRAGRVRALLHSHDAGFVIVASPAPLTLDEAVFFHRRLDQSGMPFVAFVVNRVHPDPAQGFAPTRAAADVDDDLAQALVEVFQDQKRLARSDRRSVERLEGLTGEKALLVPEFEADVHNLAELKETGDVMFGTAGGRRGRGRARSTHRLATAERKSG